MALKTQTYTALSNNKNGCKQLCKSLPQYSHNDKSTLDSLERHFISLPKQDIIFDEERAKISFVDEDIYDFGFEASTLFDSAVVPFDGFSVANN